MNNQPTYDQQGQGQGQEVVEKKLTTANLHLIESSHVIREQSSSAVCTVCPQINTDSADKSSVSSLVSDQSFRQI